MKKLLVMLLSVNVAFTLVGCTRVQDDIEIKEKIVVPTASEYLDIVVETLGSEQVASINVIESQNDMHEGAPIASYTGSVSEGIADVDVDYMNYGTEKQYNLKIDILNPSKLEDKSLKPIHDVGAGDLKSINIVSLNPNTCEVAKNILTCSKEYIIKDENPEFSKQNILLGRTNYTFEFDETTFELIKYSIVSLEFSHFVGATVESTKTYGLDPSQEIIFTEEEYTEIGKFIIDYTLENGLDGKNHINRDELTDAVIEKFDVAFMGVAIYTTEEVSYE